VKVLREQPVTPSEDDLRLVGEPAG
jgi:hypothetical protein